MYTQLPVEPDLVQPLAQLNAIRMANREWRRHLAPAELEMTNYLLDNSVQWKRRTFTTSIREMERGSPGIIPLGRSKTWIEETLRRLRVRGVVSVQDGRRPEEPSVIRMNLDWVPVAEQNNRPGKQDASCPENRDTPCPGKPDTIKGQRKEPEKEIRLAAAPRLVVGEGEGVAVGIPRLRSRVRRAVVVPSVPAMLPPVVLVGAAVSPAPAVVQAEVYHPAASTASASFPDLHSRIVACWREAWLATYPGMLPKPLGKNELAGLTNLRVHLEDCRRNFNWFDFVRFVVTDWREIMAKEFGWMTRQPPPSHPDARFLCTQKFAGKFLDAYYKRDDRRRLEAATGRDADYLRLIQNGVSHDDALLELGRRQGVGEKRAEAEKAKEHFVKQARALTADRDRARAAELRATTARPIRMPAPLPPPKPFDHGVNGWDNPHLVDIPDIEFVPFNEWEDLPLAA